MDATYTICFEGFDQKAATALEKMLREDIASYPSRVKMDNVTVKAASKFVVASEAEFAVKINTKPKAKGSKPKKGKANAKS